MSTAKKRFVNAMSAQSRNGAYASINITWLQMRPDLKFESKEDVRAERLTWIASFLGLPSLNSLTDLSDGQIGLVLDEMRRMTGTTKSLTPSEKGKIEREHMNVQKRKGNVVNIADYRQPHSSEATQADVTHLSGEAQIFTINKLVGSIGWTDEGFRDFLFQKFRRRSPRMLKFKEANSLTMILLNIAADKELRAQGKTKISRKMTADYIPTLKQKLGIDR